MLLRFQTFLVEREGKAGQGQALISWWLGSRERQCLCQLGSYSLPVILSRSSLDWVVLLIYQGQIFPPNRIILLKIPHILTTSVLYKSKCLSHQSSCQSGLAIKISFHKINWKNKRNEEKYILMCKLCLIDNLCN